MVLFLVAASAGCGIGTLVALSLDVLYTGAPLLMLRIVRCPPARRWYLPVLGAAAGLMIVRYATNLRHAALLAFFSTFLLALTAADFEHHLLPNRLMYPALASAICLGWAWPGRSWLNTLEGGGIGLLVMLTFFVVFPKLGFGDVKLAALLGLLSGASNCIPALMIGIVAGGLGAIVLLLARHAHRGSLIVYGPYLALGAFAGMLLHR